MPVNSKHPQYAAIHPDWVQMVDTKAGQRAIKEKGAEYLPPTSAHYMDGYPTVNTQGWRDYEAYKKRAVFPSFVEDSTQRMVGVINRKPPIIKLPAGMEKMRERATVAGESLEMLFQRINDAQLSTGRIGLLLEAPDGQGPTALPFIAWYSELSIINWSAVKGEDGKDKLSMVVLDETKQVLVDDFQWERKESYRVLKIGGDGMVGYDEKRKPDMGKYVVGVTQQDNMALVQYLTPQIGGTSLDQIPFVFINTLDLVPEPSKPPLLKLSDLALTVYRGEADYRQALFMQGQETLVMIGTNLMPPNVEGQETEATRVGAGAVLNLPLNGDAKYIGVSAAGLSEQREALKADRANADSAGTILLDFGDSSQQSGEALRIRVSANTASLTAVATTAAEGLQTILRIAATWMGYNPEEVEVIPNKEFAADVMPASELASLMGAKQMGAPLSQKSIHDLMKRRGLTELEYEAELEAIAEEVPLVETGEGAPGDDEDKTED